MHSYIVRRLLLALPTIILASFIIFFLVYLIPGDIIDAIRGQAGMEAPGMDRAEWERELGLDAPRVVQYGRWMGFLPQPDGDFNGFLQGNLGVSWWGGDPVLKLVAGAWPISLLLGLMSIIVSQLIALPVGLYSAIRQDTAGDYAGRSFAILCISVPYFWVGTLAVVFPAIWWGYMPRLFLPKFGEEPLAYLRTFIVPSLVMGMSLAGVTMRMTRTMMLEVIRQDYIRTAWSKGLKESVVIMRHSLKNALIPTITIIGLQMPVVIGGTVIIEQIFSLPGVGRLLVNATHNRDQPLLSGLALIFAFATIFINVAVDLTYGFLDPKIRYN